MNPRDRAGYGIIENTVTFGMNGDGRPSGEAWISFGRPDDARRAVKHLLTPESTCEIFSPPKHSAKYVPLNHPAKCAGYTPEKAVK